MQQPDYIFDSLLIIEFQTGNKKALSLLVQRWHPTFCRQANWYLKDSAVAKDVAQECWIVILKKLNSLRDPNKFAAWALTIVHRKAIDEFNKNQKSSTLTNSTLIDKATQVTQLEPSSDKEERLLLIQHGIGQLPLKQRIVIELFYKNELTLNQIAQILGLSKGTVKSRLFYAREALKQQIKTKKS